MTGCYCPALGCNYFSDQGKEVVEEGQQSPLITRRALHFLRARQETKEDRPFFMTVGYVDTHSPYRDQPEAMVEQYRKATFKDIPDETFSPAHGKCRSVVSADPKLEGEHRAQYYAAVSAIDEHVGAIVDQRACVDGRSATV